MFGVTNISIFICRQIIRLLFLFSEIYFFFLIGQLVLGLASGLEAFSREPPCDSIGALAARQTPETSGMATEFLSYYP
jgi:hypothetical protein